MTSMICPVCGNIFQDDSNEESKTPCPECTGKIHRVMKLECTIECGPNGLSKREGIIILDLLVKMMVSRGLNPQNIEFYEPYIWKETPIKKDEQKVLQMMKENRS